jgi:SNF family Na+-dependent transporter
MRDEFGWSKNKGAWSFGAMILVLGLPTVILRKECLMNMIMGWNGKFSCLPCLKRYCSLGFWNGQRMA